MLENARKIQESEKNPREKIALFVHNHLGFFLHNMNEMKVMSREDTALTADYEKRILDLKRRYLKALVDLVEELQRHERVRKLNVRVAALALFGMMNWIYTWYNPRRDPSLRPLIEQMLRIFFFGVLNDAVDDQAVEEEVFKSFLPVDKSFGLYKELWAVAWLLSCRRRMLCLALARFADSGRLRRLGWCGQS